MKVEIRKRGDSKPFFKGKVKTIFFNDVRVVWIDRSFRTITITLDEGSEYLYYEEDGELYIEPDYNL